MIGDPEKRERKREKKVKRLLRKSAYAAGIGAGLFVLRFVIAPFLGDSEQVNAALTGLSLCLIAYGVLLIITFVVKKEWLFRADMLLSWVIIPAIALKIILSIS